MASAADQVLGELASSNHKALDVLAPTESVFLQHDLNDHYIVGLEAPQKGHVPDVLCRASSYRSMSELGEEFLLVRH